MTDRKALAPILIAALLMAVAGPAMAKSKQKQQGSGEVYSTQKQGKAQSAKTCRRAPPPWMYNPRFMNRGFFKRKCPEPSQ
jgi:hypothetical protein